jgi:hypothetical protein
MYLTYEEYQNMGGTLEEIPFNDFEFQAEAQINYATFNRLKNDATFSNEVKRLTKYLIDLLEKKAAAFSLGKGSSSSADSGVYITSQSNDGVSVSYNGMAPTDLVEMCKTEVLTAIRNYLDGVKNEAGHKLLYRGLYPGE